MTDFYIYTKKDEEDTYYILPEKIEHKDFNLVTPMPRTAEELLDVMKYNYSTFVRIYDLSSFLNSLEEKTKLLWISRHPPLPVQIDTLEKKFNNVTIDRYSKKIENIESLQILIDKYQPDYILPVLPMTIIMRLVELSKQSSFNVLYAEMELLHNEITPDNCPEFEGYRDVIVDRARHYRFDKFVKLTDVSFEKEEL